MSEGRIAAVASDRWLEALDWHTRLRETVESELPHEKIHAWQAWVSDDQNRRVFDQVSRLLEDGPKLRKRRLPSLNKTDSSESPEPVVPRQKPATPRFPQHNTTPHRRRTSRLIALVSVAAAMVFVGLIVSLRMPENVWEDITSSGRAQVYQTALGEVRRLTLEDGSKLILGGNSEVSVRFSGERRSVSVARGEAWFEVAHNPARPFVVTAGARTITAVGTAFVVQRAADRVVLTVTDGTVEVASKSVTDVQRFALGRGFDTARGSAARVSHGQQMTYEGSGSVSTVEGAVPKADPAWSQGQLEFDHVPLWYVVQAVNPYSRRIITLDQSSRNELFTGVVLQEQVDQWIEGLKSIYPVEIIEHDGQVCVQRQAPSADQGSSRCR